eukprot:s497_g23.t1
MQHWKAKHAEKVVAGGALRGHKFKDLTQDQLSKAAKRYPADQKLQRYAKAIIASMELDGNEQEPEPCLSVALRESAGVSPGTNRHGWEALKKLLYQLNLYRLVTCALVCVALVFILKPSLATACTKVFVQFVRLMLRRATSFLVLLLEGLLDELVYQIEFSIRQALPDNIDLEQMARAPLKLLSHCISALAGAGVILLATYMQARRGQIPAQG